MWAELLSLAVKMPGSAANSIGDLGLGLPWPGSGFTRLPSLGLFCGGGSGGGGAAAGPLSPTLSPGKADAHNCE